MKSLLINLSTMALAAGLIYLTWHVSAHTLRIVVTVGVGFFYGCYRLFVAVLQASRAEEEMLNAPPPTQTPARPQRIRIG